MDVSRQSRAVGPVALVVAVQVVALLAMAPFYGPHRDELYFDSAGQRLAWGYPDQPSFTPFVARLAHTVAPHSLVALRVPSLLAMVGLVLLSAYVAWLLGGSRSAQTLTAVVVATSAVVMAYAHRLSTATFDAMFWTAVLVLVTRALVEHRPRFWLAAGLVAGVGLNNKHSVAFLLGAVLVAVALDPVTRPALRTVWPWLGGLVALVCWVPNLVWQAAHGWPVFALTADIADEYGGVGGRLELVVQTLIMFSPVIAAVWIWGLVALLRRREWASYRFLAVTFLLLVLLFLVTGGKGYYLSGAVPPLIAAGCVRLVDGPWLARLRHKAPITAVVLALSAMVAWPSLVPVLPERTFAGSFYTGLDDAQIESIGWPEYVGEVRRVLHRLPPAQRRTAVVFTSNYGEAGAMEWYDVGAPVYSGHNGWRFFGQPSGARGPVLLVGEEPGHDFVGCRRAGHLHNDLGADNDESGMPLWLCARPRGSWAQRWPDLVHYDA